MSEVGSLIAWAWRGVERHAAGRWALPAVAGGAAAAYTVVSIAFPLWSGRDLSTYLRVYLQLFDPEAPWPQAMTARTPLGALVAGGLLEAGGLVAEAAMGSLFVLSVLAWFLVARRFGAGASAVAALLLVAFPGYAMLFHRLSTDALFAAAFAGVALLAARVYERLGVGRSAALGGGVAALVLIRPSAQVFLVLALVPLLAAGRPRARLLGAAAFAAASVAPLAGWALHNGLRFDDYAVARGGGVTLPFFRAFVEDRIVSPENGPASRELAAAVERELLPYEPYRSYGIDLDEFFSSGSARMHEDFIGLSDRVWGWDDDYAHVAAAGWEAVRAHPWIYSRAVADDVGIVLRTPLTLEPIERRGNLGGGAAGESETVLVNGRELPRPSEGEPIPAARQSGYVSTPDQRAREVWTSPTEHHVEFRDRRDATRAAAIDRRIVELFAAFPQRSGPAWLQDALNSASAAYPRSILLVFVGALALAARRPRGWPLPALLAGSALLLIIATMLAVYPVAEYVVPLAPSFVVLVAAGVAGERAPRTVASARAASVRTRHAGA